MERRAGPVHGLGHLLIASRMLPQPVDQAEVGLGALRLPGIGAKVHSVPSLVEKLSHALASFARQPCLVSK